MTDLYDRATEREEQLREAALEDQAHRSGLQGKTVADSATHCRVCSERIPVGRRRAIPGVQTCTECQRDLELAMRQQR